MGFRTLVNHGFLKRLGIARHAIRKDLLFFFFPWLIAMLVELILCGEFGEGLSGFWQVLWALVTHPQNLLVLPLHRTIGLSLFVVGLTIMIVGQTTLRVNYSGFVVIKKDHQLITHGIYRFTRNPIYFGTIIVFTGLPVYAASVYGFLAMFAQMPIFLFRIKMEEKMLAEYFGDAYESYRNRTKRLIPFLY